MARGLRTENGKGLDEPTRGNYRPLPEVSGRRYRPKGDRVLVTRARRDSPPQAWDASTPDPMDETGEMRWFWLFLVFLGALLVACQGGLLG